MTHRLIKNYMILAKYYHDNPIVSSQVVLVILETFNSNQFRLLIYLRFLVGKVAFKSRFGLVRVIWILLYRDKEVVC